MISVTIKTTTKRLIIHEAEWLTSILRNDHHKISVRNPYHEKNWNKRLTNTWETWRKTIEKLEVISRWPRARQWQGPMRMLQNKQGGKPAGQDTSSYIMYNCVYCYQFNLLIINWRYVWRNLFNKHPFCGWNIHEYVWKVCNFRKYYYRGINFF